MPGCYGARRPARPPGEGATATRRRRWCATGRCHAGCCLFGCCHALHGASCKNPAPNALGTLLCSRTPRPCLPPGCPLSTSRAPAAARPASSCWGQVRRGAAQARHGTSLLQCLHFSQAAAEAGSGGTNSPPLLHWSDLPLTHTARTLHCTMFFVGCRLGCHELCACL